MAVEKVRVFCNGYSELACLCNGTDRHEIRGKTSIGALLNLKEFWKFPLRGDFASKPPFLGCFVRHFTGLRV